MKRIFQQLRPPRQPLGYGGYLDLDKGGGAMGLGPRRLEEPLKAFQAKNGLKVDGLLKPGGPTITKMKQLYGKAFAGSPAPTPAMMDVQAELIDEGQDGFIYGAAPKPLPKPNKRLDAKTELFDYERWNDDWARNATDPASYAPEYESYIRQIEPTHGHDPGLIYARDFAQKVEKRRGKGGEFVQSLLARLSDRPDLQRAFLGGEVPTHPPQGTFRPDGEAGVKDWIDQDRIANGMAPKYSKAAQASAPVLRTSSGVASAPQATEPDPKNLLEYGPNFGLPEDQALAQQPPHAPDLPNPRPVEPRAAEQAPPALAPREPASGEGGAGWYDPNQMNPEGTHRRPKPDNSRGFEDEFPAPWREKDIADASKPAPLGPPDSRDPKDLSDDELHAVTGATREGRERAEAEFRAAQEAHALAEADLDRRMKPRHREVAEIVAQGAAMGMPQGAMTGPIIAKIFKIPTKVPTVLGTLFDAAKGGAAAGGLDQYKAYLEWRKLSEGRDAAANRRQAAEEMRDRYKDKDDALTNERESRRSGH